MRRPTQEERDLAHSIGWRAAGMSFGKSSPLDIISAVLLVHTRSCPLDLEGLKDAPDPLFEHDVFGIRDNIDWDTGELKNCFVPRMVRPKTDG